MTGIQALFYGIRVSHVCAFLAALVPTQGAVAGAKVIQAFSKSHGATEGPLRSVFDMVKVFLEPGQSRKVTFTATVLPVGGAQAEWCAFCFTGLSSETLLPCPLSSCFFLKHAYHMPCRVCLGLGDDGSRWVHPGRHMLMLGHAWEQHESGRQLEVELVGSEAVLVSPALRTLGQN